jgi:hypothetical protein
MTVLLDFFLCDPETLTKGEYDEIFDFLGFDEPVSFLLYIIAFMAAGVFDICRGDMLRFSLFTLENFQWIG